MLDVKDRVMYAIGGKINTGNYYYIIIDGVTFRLRLDQLKGLSKLFNILKGDDENECNEDMGNYYVSDNDMVGIGGINHDKVF